MAWDEQFEFEAIGTHWVIDFLKGPKKDTVLLLKKIQDEIARFSKIFSRFDKTSEVFLASQAPREIIIPKKYVKLVEAYEMFYKRTNSMFTPLVGNLLAEAGYTWNYSLVPNKLNRLKNWDEVLELSDSVLKVKQPWTLDFGAGGKGFIVDVIGNLLKQEGISDFSLDAGGDILYKTKSKESLRVGLEHPENLDQVVGIAEIKNQSICGSAGNRRKWGNLHHIFNPKKLDSVRGVLAVWVIADDALTADVISTCLFFTDPKILKDLNFEYLIIYPNYTFIKSDSFPAEIYLNG